MKNRHINTENRWVFVCHEESLGAKFLEMLAMKYYAGTFDECYTITSPFGPVIMRLGSRNLLSDKDLLQEIESNNLVAPGQLPLEVLSSTPILFPAPDDEPIEHIMKWFIEDTGNDSSQTTVFRY
jgi:hypothetical protein